MAGRLHVVSKHKKQFIDDAVFAAERVKGEKLSGPVKKEMLRVAREQLLGQRQAEGSKQARAEERQAAEFTWSKPEPFRR